jgi:hypothetical protein
MKHLLWLVFTALFVIAPRAVHPAAMISQLGSSGPLQQVVDLRPGTIGSGRAAYQPAVGNAFFSLYPPPEYRHLIHF